MLKGEIFVQFPDYPRIRIILRRGWKLINLCAPVDGLILFLP